MRSAQLWGHSGDFPRTRCGSVRSLMALLDSHQTYLAFRSCGAVQDSRNGYPLPSGSGAFRLRKAVIVQAFSRNNYYACPLTSYVAAVESVGMLYRFLQQQYDFAGCPIPYFCVRLLPKKFGIALWQKSYLSTAKQYKNRLNCPQNRNQCPRQRYRNFPALVWDFPKQYR